MVPEWPSSRGGEYQGERLTESGGNLAPRPYAKIHLTEKPNTRRLQETEIHMGGGIGSNRKEIEVPMSDDPPGTDRDLSAGQGRQRGE